MINLLCESHKNRGINEHFHFFWSFSSLNRTFILTNSSQGSWHTQKSAYGDKTRMEVLRSVEFISMQFYAKFQATKTIRWMTLNCIMLSIFRSSFVCVRAMSTKYHKICPSFSHKSSEWIAHRVFVPCFMHKYTQARTHSSTIIIGVEMMFSMQLPWKSVVTLIDNAIIENGLFYMLSFWNICRKNIHSNT